MTPETTQKRPKRPWSRGDKLLVIVPVILAALACVLFFWLRALDNPPVASLPPPTTMPAVNACDYFLKAANAAVVTGSVGPNSQAVRLLHQGFRYPYQEPPYKAFMLPKMRAMTVLARQLGEQANADAGKGRWNASVNAGLDAVQMGVSMMHGAGSLGALRGSISQQRGSKPLWADVDHLTAPQAQAAARRLETITANRVSYLDVVTAAKEAAQRGLTKSMKQPNWRDQWATVNHSPLTAPRGWTSEALLATRLRITSKAHILTANATLMDAFISAARHPYAARPPAPPWPTDPVNRMMYLPNDDLWAITLAADTKNELLLTAFALRAYRLDHGAYPAALASLVPGYLKEVPADPFALSGSLHYKRVGTKYLLYSIGPDGKDGGGKPILNSPDNWVNRDSIGDIVAGVNI